MRRRNVVRVVSFSLSIAFFCTIWTFKIKKERDYYFLQTENNNSYMLDRLNSSTNNISQLLNKGRFMTTKDGLAQIATELLCQAEISKNSLSQLPNQEELTSLNKFYSQVGNYALSLSDNLEDEALSMQDTANVEMLSQISVRVAEIVSTSRDSFNNSEYWAKEIDKEVENAAKEKTLSSTLGELEGEFKDYPTLIYDGPYSDHIYEKEPQMLINTAFVTKEDAKSIASKWSKSSPQGIDFAGETAGKIPTFDFLGEGLTVSITKQGGYVLFFRKERQIEDMVLSNEQARIKANEYLSDMAMYNMRETYYYEADGICTVNFAFMDGKTLCYTDLIKVGVAMDTGEIVLYESAGYISNHRERAFEVPSFTEEQAQEIISSKLTVENVKLALIPTNAKEESRCYEFTCVSGDKQELLVYINTADLSEEEILILQKSDGGVLVS